MTTMRADLPEAMEALEKWLRKPPSALRSMYRAGSRESYADEARELAETAKAAALALRALRDAPVGCVQAFAPYSVDVAFTDRYAHGLDLRQRVALVPLDTTLGSRPVVDEADGLLRELGLDPERFRSEGGAINASKVRAAIKHPAEYAGLYLPNDHAFVHHPKLGAQLCADCGAVKGTGRGRQPCTAAALRAPEQSS